MIYRTILRLAFILSIFDHANDHPHHDHEDYKPIPATRAYSSR